MMFEHISILKGDLTKEDINKEIKKFKEYFEEHNIEIETFENIGLKKLAYEIKNHKDGYYLRYEFFTTEDKIPTFEKFIRENENVLKFITIRTEKERMVDRSVFERIDNLNESNLFKAIAESVAYRLQNENEDGRNIKFDLDDIKDITEVILDDDYFSECMSNAISYALDKKYPEQENEEESEGEL